MPSLAELVSYDPKTGVFRRKKTGKIVGSPDTYGALRIFFKGRRYKLHRVAWRFMTGKWPKDQIDHRNGNPADNRWSNLREASNSQNQGNRRKNKRKLGAKGVYRENGANRDNRWRATLARRKLGSFGTQAEAMAAYHAAACRYFGEFARV